MAEERLKDNPISSLDLPFLKELIQDFYKKEFEGKDSVTLKELEIGAKLARSEFIPQPGVVVGHGPKSIFTA